MLIKLDLFPVYSLYIYIYMTSYACVELFRKLLSYLVPKISLSVFETFGSSTFWYSDTNWFYYDLLDQLCFYACAEMVTNFSSVTIGLLVSGSFGRNEEQCWYRKIQYSAYGDPKFP